MAEEPEKRGLAIPDGQVTSRSDVLPPSDQVDNTAEQEDLESTKGSLVKTVPTKKNDKTVEETVRSRRPISPPMYKYPSDISSDAQPHSVRFTVKIREQSKAGKAAKANNKKVNYDESNTNRLSDEEYKNLTNSAAVLGGGAIGSVLAKKATGGGNNAVVKAVSGVGGAVAGAGVGLYIADKIQDKVVGNRLIKTTDIIDLYIPQSPQVNYGANWQETDIGALTGLLAQSGGDIADIFTGDTPGGLEFAAQTMAGFADLPKALGVNVDFKGALQSASGKVPNPNKEQLFKSMNFRNFTFEYKFAPKNSSELESVRQIIQTFKKNMHTEKDPSGLFLLYPSEFDIQFLYRHSENQFLHKIKSCALADLRLTYGNSGSFTTIKGQSGAPSEITMTLVFKELETLTRDEIEQGY